MKKIIAIIMEVAIFFSIVPGQKASALQPIGFYDFESPTPQGFVHWVNNKPSDVEEWRHNRFVNTYKKEQDYILAPNMQGAVSDGVKWGTKDTSINYWFSGNDLYWTIFVYPVKIIKNEYYYSDNIEDLMKKKTGRYITSFDQIDYYSGTDVITGKDYETTVSYKKKKLQLGDKSTVDCIQEISRTKSGNQWKEEIYLHFFKEKMYFYVIVNGYTDNNEKNVTQAMSKCTFQKYYTNPRLELNKKKNKVSRKNAILYATLQNPTKSHFTYVKLFIYDKKAKKYKFRYMQKMSKKDETKKDITVKLNVKQCIKKGVSQLTRMERRRVAPLKVSGKKYVRRKMKALPLERKKKYKYKIQVKVGANYYDVTGSFRLK